MKALNQTKATIIIRKDEIQLSLEVRLVEVAIVHHNLNIPEETERLCLAVIEALQKRGHNA
jgi:hypothetical protein